MHDATSWRSPHLPGVEVSRREHAGPPARFRLVPMVGIKLVVTGEAELRWGSDFWRASPGHCMVVAPERNFRVVRRVTETASTLHAYIAPQLFDAWMGRHQGPRCADFELRHGPDPELAGALLDLARDLKNAAELPVVHASFDRAMARVQHLLGATHGTVKFRRPQISKALEFLRERFGHPVPLDQLTEQTGLSKFHLLRLFRDETGLTPHAFHLQLRISRARQLLVSGVAIAEVAAACGFADQAHFSRCFKSRVGYTPGEFRQLD